MKQTNTDTYKRIAGEYAADFVENRMTIGLGSGSTVYWMMHRLSIMIKNGLDVQGVPTSDRTQRWAKELGIPLTDFSSVERIDIAIDGADAIDGELNLIKGGGGSLVREKIVDAIAEKLIIIADPSKMVKTFDAIPVPVEVVPFGYEVTAQKIKSYGFNVVLRRENDAIFISDNGNYIFDCILNEAFNPLIMHNNIKSIIGIIETGLFNKMTDMVIIGNSDGVSVIES